MKTLMLMALTLGLRAEYHAGELMHWPEQKEIRLMAGTEDVSFPEGSKHGSFLAITKEEAVRLVGSR